jgi:glycosyltransferase involved in cell wall biosynthesis
VRPLLSIITINRNDAAGLERTLSSVANQSYREFELIVIDAASTDGSVEVIRRHPNVVSDWVSEPDGGIYEAQNKGFARSRGTYLLFLNSGDALASERVLDIILAGPPREEIVYGDVIYEDGEGRRKLRRFPDRPTVELFMTSSLCHQATIIHRSLFERFGPYDTDLRLASDYELFLKAVVVHGVATRHVPIPFAIHDTTGISWCWGTRARYERRLVQRRTLSPPILDLWEEHVRAARPLKERAKLIFRPLARRMRSFSRWLRGVPEPAPQSLVHEPERRLR